MHLSQRICNLARVRQPGSRGPWAGSPETTKLPGWAARGFAIDVIDISNLPRREMILRVAFLECNRTLGSERPFFLKPRHRQRERLARRRSHPAPATHSGNTLPKPSAVSSGQVFASSGFSPTSPQASREMPLLPVAGRSVRAIEGALCHPRQSAFHQGAGIDEVGGRHFSAVRG
jgi:hypothetical protein